MATAQEVSDEVNGVAADDHHAALMHAGGPAALQHIARSVQDKLTHAAKEVTLWLVGRTLDSDEIKKLLDNPTRKDTTLGHAINAAAFGRVNYLILQRIAEHLDVDISDIK